MKQYYILVVGILLGSARLTAQVDLPYTLDFTSNQSVSGDLIEDGQGGTADINGLNFEIFPTSQADYTTPLPVFHMVWKDNSYWLSGDGSFNGVGPDYDVDGNGVPALVLKSDNVVNRFSLQSMELYDWGGTSPWTISTYRNGVLVGSVNVNFDQTTYPPLHVSQADVLTPAYFQNIDEIRMIGPSGFNIYPVVNQIALSPAVTLPVTLIHFGGSAQDGMAVLQWQAGEEDLGRYEIQSSADVTNFATVATVPARGSGSIYTQQVAQSAGSAYYRLKMIDQDNHISFSNVINIRAGKGLSVFLYPDPAKDHININTAKGGHAFLMDATGKIVRSFLLQTGLNKETLSSLAAGIYYLVEGDQKVSFIKE